MPLLAEADAVYVGGLAADKVYLGDTLVWEPAAEGSWGPQERMLLDAPWAVTGTGVFNFGSQFDVLAAGRITHIRYWSSDTTSTQQLALWNSSRVKIAGAVDIPGVIGWREVPLPSPLRVEAGTYTVSRFASGPDSGTWKYSSPPNHTSDSPNLSEPLARYAPGGSGESFPDGDGFTNCYFVDVVYQRDDSGAPFSPADIPGLAAWFDPAQDMFGDGERITSYREHSPNQRVFAGHGGAVFRAGGAPYIELQGDGHLQYDTWNAGPVGLTFVAVNSLTTPAQPMMLIAHHSSVDGYEMRWDSMQMQTAAAWQTAFAYHIHSVPDQQNVKQQHMWRFDVSGQVADSWVGSVRESSSATVMPNVPSFLFLGVRYGGYWYTGKVYEALVFEGAVSDADLSQLRGYLTTKHGL